jgi:GTP pyrophosphokinase
MEDLFNKLIDICKQNGYSDDEMSTINRAYQFALKQHEGMKRKNGEDYISHPLNVAIIVANLNVDATTVICALVHETIDHGSSSFEEIEELFGSEVKDIVSSLTKVNRLHLTDDSESSSVYLRKVLVALSEDVRVIILKLAGRVHNLRTNEGLSKEKQKQKALETWNVLVPIAARLNINELKDNLEELSFKYLKPEIYEEIEAELPAKRSELEAMVDEVTANISDALNNEGIEFKIKNRVKSISSIHNKLSNGKKWSNIYDIMGIRVICNSEADCYLIIGIVHSLYRPIPKRFKDYIAMPKGNSYQSLHTGVFGPNGLPVEVQVRTKEMDEIAEHGIASHWSYKEKSSKTIQSVMEQKLQMFRNTIEANSQDLTSDDDFVNNVSSELLTTSIYVFTPKGDVVELPKGSTPIDFAYRIHSKVGDTTVGAIVNDQMVTLDYELKDNDVVKIMTNQNSTPNKDWLNIAKTTAAKTKIKAYFSKNDREEYISRGKELFERELRRQKISFADAYANDKIDKLIKDLKVSTLDDVYLNIGSLRYTPFYVVNLLFENKNDVQDILVLDKVNNQMPSKTNYKNDIIVSGCDDLLVNLASCCKPVFGDEIVGYITKGQGITVHKKNCSNIINVTERLIDVEWNNNKNSNDTKYITKLSILTNGIDNSILDIVTKATIRNVSITGVNEVNKNNNTYYDVLVKVQNKDNLDLFISDLENLSFVISVKRF